MKRVMYFFLLLISLKGSLFAQDEPINTVEDYVTTAEVDAMMKDLKAIMSQEIQNSLLAFFSEQKNNDSVSFSNNVDIRWLTEKTAFLQKQHDSIILHLQRKLSRGDYQYVLYDISGLQESTEDIQIMNEDYDWTFTEDPLDIPANKNPYSIKIITAVGWHNWLNSSENIPDIRSWRSGFFEIGVLSRYRFSKSNRNSPYYASLAATIITNSVRFAGNSYLKNTAEPVFELSPQNLELNSFNRTGMVFSAGLAYISAKKNGFLCEIKGYAAIRLQSHTTQGFVAENSTNIVNTYGLFGQRPVNMGISAAIGTKTLSLYGRYDITSLFKNQVFGGVYPFSIGLRFF
jgi:hypothetical protein